MTEYAESKRDEVIINMKMEAHVLEVVKVYTTERDC